MKQILFGIAGIMMALALVVGAPGTAKATATAVTLSGPGNADYNSSYRFSGGNLTITEGTSEYGVVPAWMFADTTDGTAVWVTNGVIKITGATVTLSGSLENLLTFAPLVSPSQTCPARCSRSRTTKVTPGMQISQISRR